LLSPETSIALSHELLRIGGVNDVVREVQVGYLLDVSERILTKNSDLDEGCFQIGEVLVES
jgi:hypothetical protein